MPYFNQLTMIDAYLHQLRE